MMSRSRQRGASPVRAESSVIQRDYAPSEILIKRDIVARLLADDARSEPRERWLGLALAAATVALFASGAGVPLLAAAFCLAPFIGFGMEVFAPSERHGA